MCKLNIYTENANWIHSIPKNCCNFQLFLKISWWEKYMHDEIFTEVILTSQKGIITSFKCIRLIPWLNKMIVADNPLQPTLSASDNTLWRAKSLLAYWRMFHYILLMQLWCGDTRLLDGLFHLTKGEPNAIPHIYMIFF